MILKHQINMTVRNNNSYNYTQITKFTLEIENNINTMLTLKKILNLFINFA